MKFTKLHGLGNDYLFFDCTKEELENPAEVSKKLSDRNFGAGSDGIILILPSKTSDFRMRIFNSDGSEAEMCGNGVRSFTKYVYDHGLTDKKNLKIETLAGTIKPEIVELDENNKVKLVKVNMGEPRLLRSEIPMLGTETRVVNEQLQLKDRLVRITCVSMGNPHAVTFVDSLDINVERIGKEIENHEVFPKRINVEFIQVLNENEINMRVWERGSGETLACGTGACASVVACVLNKKTNREVTVHLKGGDLNIEWNEKDNHVYMTGPTVEVYTGEYKEV